MGFTDAGDERRPVNCTHFSQVNKILFFIYLFFIITALFCNATRYILDYLNSIYIDMEEITMLSSFAESEPDYVARRRFWMNYFPLKESSDNLKLLFLTRRG